MNQKNEIKLFDVKLVRTIWDIEQKKRYFSVTDVIEVLTDTDKPKKYWNDFKKKLQKKEFSCTKELDN